MTFNGKALSILAISAIAFLSGCKSDGEFTGRIWFPDMTYSQAYETYTENPFPNQDGDSISARKPVSGTIPYGYLPDNEEVRTNLDYMNSYLAKEVFMNPVYHPELDVQQYEMSSMLKNPLPADEYNLAEGKRVYGIFCAVCHGDKGEGGGSIVVIKDEEGNELGPGPYTAVPPVYSARLAEITEGQAFYSVSYGKGQMGGYGSQLTVEERWQVLHYIYDLSGTTPIQGAGTFSDMVVMPDTSSTEAMVQDTAAEEVNN
jgi:hypothetical protein